MLNRQRGVVSTLVLVGIAAVLVLGALGTFIYQIRESGYDSAEAKYRPEMERAQANEKLAAARATDIDSKLTAALLENAALLVIIAELRDTFKATQDELAKIKVAQSQQAAELKKQLDQFIVREKRQSAEITRLRAIVAMPVITEGVLDETDAILRSLIRDRIAGGVRQ
jgi:cell division protein FtsI/penicillin-binding protein 2